MEKEAGVCSRELAQRLKKSGEKQKCLWYWQYNGKNHLLPEYTLECGRGYGISKKDCYAPTVAELGERLPYYIQKGFISYDLVMIKGKDKYILLYFNDAKREKLFNQIWDKTEANARAKMLIYLLENKLIGEG